SVSRDWSSDVCSSDLLAPNVQAQQVRPAASGDIYKQLQQLQRMGTVMYIAAHPDDENTRLITYLVHHDHINTIYLSLTRGDGGRSEERRVGKTGGLRE